MLTRTITPGVAIQLAELAFVGSRRNLIILAMLPKWEPQ